MIYPLEICHRCGRGFVKEHGHCCDPLDTDKDFHERNTAIWFLLFFACTMGLFLYWLLK